MAKKITKFGSKTPFGEPGWYHGDHSPYYDETHIKFRAKVRAFCDKHIKPYVEEWNEKGDYPLDICKLAYKEGIWAAMFPEEYGGTPPEGTKERGGPDAFHDLILCDELSRCGAPPIFSIFTMALPPVLKFGPKELRDKVARECLTAEKHIALCISEPWAGSDVANIRTTAKKDGDFYIVNGEKKYITIGLKADYFTVAVRTGGPGALGISLLLVERKTPGISVRKIKTQGEWMSPPAYITFEDVKVPVKNLIGKENHGFRVIMYNFNHERFTIAAGALRAGRTCLEEAISYAKDRKTFGKRLIDHQVIRAKIAEMSRMVESTQAFLEQIAYQLKTGANEQLIGGSIALCKVQATRTMEFCAREASQILGGASYLREGKGATVERIYRAVRGSAIPGGSEEIMLDLAGRLAKL